MVYAEEYSEKNGLHIPNDFIKFAARLQKKEFYCQYGCVFLFNLCFNVSMQTAKKLRINLHIIT